MGAELVHKSMHDLVHTLSGSRDEIFSSILDYNEQVKKTTKSLILEYLQDKALGYKDTRRAGSDKQYTGVEISPLIGDIVTYEGSAKEIRMGIVTEILGRNIVELRIIKSGRSQIITSHVKLLKMVYRDYYNDPKVVVKEAVNSYIDHSPEIHSSVMCSKTLRN